MILAAFCFFVSLLKVWMKEVQLECMRTSELYRIHGAGVTYSEIICGRMVIALLDVDDRHCQITFLKIRFLPC